MNTTVLLLGQFFSLSAKLVVSAVLLTVYIKSRRRSAVVWAFAWLVAAMSIAADALGVLQLVSLTEATFSSLLFLGSLAFLSEELGRPVRYQTLWAAPPLVTAMYGILLGNDWSSVVGIPYGVAAFFIVLTGIMIITTINSAFTNARRTAFSLCLLGLHKMDYPFLRDVEWFAPLGFVLGAILTVFSAYFMAKMVLSREFTHLGGEIKITVKPGIELVASREYKRIKEDLNGYPVLAFIRELSVPDKWKAYFLTSLPGKDTIPPTNLPRILELSGRYLQEAETRGITGVVLIDGIEYLIIHNGMTAVTKFIGTLRDLVILRDGRLIVVADEKALDRKDYLTIKRVLMGG
ncbi:DUF835 domain-containing protein [Thermococcus thioreducens]|uniref:DUF835 domain-containing protein n=1 Tax=Thermococcus thioreducens TaxID=277988 RepID=A0A0Q2M3B4_9EURY|nr:DUF835 domain-containing protein [Thermococcus thioreducens]ASJ11715.1 hypothetical protein A3L14_01890 [Thermococcus thioreducens]KQH82553.1 hypothetical protein AMR53_04550 [Thermococcus thioreducens]SEW15103.1 Protein of unknown function [Thermococcus thioreducens]